MSSNFSGFGAFANHVSSASVALTRHHVHDQQNQQQQKNQQQQQKPKPNPLYVGKDAHLIQIFKRIGQKRDVITKTRALAELITYAFPIQKQVQEQQEQTAVSTPLQKSDQIIALSHFFFLFANKLIHDNHPSVRSESLKVLSCALYHVPKAFQTLLLCLNDNIDHKNNNNSSSSSNSSSNVGSVGNVIGWVYTSIHSQIMEVSKIATQVWNQITKLLLLQNENNNNDNDNNSMVQTYMVSHVNSILQHSSKPSSLADALSIIGNNKYKKKENATQQQQQQQQQHKQNKDNKSTFINQSDIDDMEERYERVVILTLEGMRHFVSTFPEKKHVVSIDDKNQQQQQQQDSSFQYEHYFVNKAVLWKHLNNTRASFRRATYNLIASLSQNAPSCIHPPMLSSSSSSSKKKNETMNKNSNLCSLITKSLSSEKDPSNFTSMFEMILLFIASFRAFGDNRSAWSSKSNNKTSYDNDSPPPSLFVIDSDEFTKALCKTLRRACYGSPPSQWGPSMLPLIVSLPSTQQQLQVLAALWAGATTAINTADSAAIVTAVSESSTYLLLQTNNTICTNDNNDNNQNTTFNDFDYELSIEIANALLESISFYLNVPFGGNASTKAEHNLKNVIVNDLFRLITLGSTKYNCNFYHIQQWFWNEGIMNVMLCHNDNNHNDDDEMSEQVLHRMNRLFQQMLDIFKKEEEEEGRSNKEYNINLLLPVLQTLFWAKLQPKETKVPSFQQTSLMLCILKLCGLESIFSDESGISSSVFENFCMNTLINWILFHTSLKNNRSGSNSGEEEEMKPLFVMLSMMITILTERKMMWEIIIKNLVHPDLDLRKLALGLKIVILEIDPEIRYDLICESLDSLAIETAKMILIVDSDENTTERPNNNNDQDFSTFLHVCAGVESGMPCGLVSMKVIQSWIDLCVTTQNAFEITSSNKDRNRLLETLLSCCTKLIFPISDVDTQRLIFTAWSEGSLTWNTPEVNKLLESESARSKLVQTASTSLKAVINRNNFKEGDIDSNSLLWSQRSWRLIQLLDNWGDESFNRISILGLDDTSTWRMAMKIHPLSSFLFSSMVHLLRNFDVVSDRKKFLVNEAMSNKLVLIFMAFAKKSKTCGNYIELSRCNYLSLLIGGVELFSEEECKSFVTSTVDIVSKTLSDGSDPNQLSLGVAILDWFISHHVDKLNDPTAFYQSSDDDTDAKEITEGQELWYVVDGNNDASDRVKATIIKVHTDDFPNLYFTIRIADDTTKQTISSRLKKNPICVSQSQCIKEVQVFDKLIPEIEGIITRDIVKPYLLHENDIRGNVAAQCLNIITSRFGFMGGAGVGSLRYDIFQLLIKLENQILCDINESNMTGLSDHLRRISLALGYGQHTSPSESNPEVLKFNCDKLMTNLLNFFDKDRDICSISFSECFLMWLTVSTKSSMDETTAPQIFAVAHEFASGMLAQNCYENNEVLLLMLLRLIHTLQKAMIKLPKSLRAVTIDAEQNMIAIALKLFVNCDDQPISSSDTVLENPSYGEDIMPTNTAENHMLLNTMKSFTVWNLNSDSSSILYGARMHVEDLCEILVHSSKQWCAFQLLSALSKTKNELYEKDDDLSPKTLKNMEGWLDNLDEEEAAEIEEDVLVSGMYLPRHLMRYLEDCSQIQDVDDEVLLKSILLKFLLCLGFLDTAAASDMRNRAHIASYINLTGGVEFVLGVAIHFADLGKTHKGSKSWLRNMAMESEECNFNLVDLSTLVLFRSVESIPTLFKSWWNNECPRSMQSVINQFVEAMVAPETLRRELDRIRVAPILGEMSVTGSCVSREITATYIQDECQLSVMIRVPPSFPLRNVEVDCQKTLGIAEKRWRHWSLQIMLMLNSQDGSILDALMLWKSNVDKEFEGVEPCPVCYSVLCVKTHAMPNLECKTCHNRFHTSCLYKWFSSSGKNQCVLCQQPWSGTKVGK